MHCNDNKSSSSNCQILLFSATMTLSLQRLNQISNHKDDHNEFLPLSKIIVHEQQQQQENEDSSNIVSKLPAGLVQEYIFMPSHIRDAYLVATIQELLLPYKQQQNNHHDDHKRGRNKRQRYNNKKQDID